MPDIETFYGPVVLIGWGLSALCFPAFFPVMMFATVTASGAIPLHYFALFCIAVGIGNAGATFSEHQTLQATFYALSGTCEISLAIALFVFSPFSLIWLPFFLLATWEGFKILRLSI